MANTLTTQEAVNQLASNSSTAASNQQTTGVVTQNVKSTAGSIASFRVSNANAAVRYFQIWDTATVAGTGSLLRYYILPAGSATNPATLHLDREYLRPNVVGATGLAFGFSTTAATYTAATAADHSTDINYA